MPLNKFWRRLFHPEVEFQVLKSHSAVELTCYSTMTSSTSSIPLVLPNHHHHQHHQTQNQNRRRTSCQPSKARKGGLAGSRSASVGRDGLDPSRRSGRPRQLNPIPRYYSHYESFGCSPPMTQLAALDDELAVITGGGDQNGSSETTAASAAAFINFSPPRPANQQKTCIVFCFMERKPNTTGGLLSTRSLGPDELTAALLAEDEKPVWRTVSDENLRMAMNLCQRYRQEECFKEGVLLKTVESESLHNYVHYASFSIKDGRDRLEIARQLSKLNRRCAQDMKYRQQQGAYEELYSIVRKPEPFDTRLPAARNAGHIIVGFKLLTLDNADRLETSWMQWSGAGEIARSAPKHWQLRRITFHRQIFTLQDESGRWIPAPDGFMYVLLCEFENLMQPPNVVMGCDLVERLRVRGCGHVGIYKVQWAYAHRDAPNPPTVDPTTELIGEQDCCKCDDEDQQRLQQSDTANRLVHLSPVISDDEIATAKTVGVSIPPAAV